MEELQNNSQKVEYVILKNAFFERNFKEPDEIPDFIKGKKQRESRVYVCIKVTIDSNTYLIPLRKKLKNLPEKLSAKAGYPVPSTTRPNAGLDFTKIIVVNDPSLYEVVPGNIAATQKDIIRDNFQEIIKIASEYIEGFKKAAKKNRQKRESLYKYSALNNFLLELGIESK